MQIPSNRCKDQLFRLARCQIQSRHALFILMHMANRIGEDLHTKLHCQ